MTTPSHIFSSDTFVIVISNNTLTASNCLWYVLSRQNRTVPKVCLKRKLNEAFSIPYKRRVITGSVFQSEL